MARLDGKVAFVTGAGGGIGRALCERFIAEGAIVAATDVDASAARAAIATAAPAQAIAIECDAGDSDSVRDAVAGAVSAFGLITTLCNLAGGSSNQDDRVTDASEDEFWRVIRLDLFGPFIACKYGLPHLIRAGGGSVINMTSMAALMAVPRRDCYTAAKGGVAALTHSLAAGYGEYGIRVNALAPGITRTPRVAASLETNADFRQLAERHLLGVAEPVDVANTAVYLASDESRVVTGQIFRVDSGVTIH